MRVVGYYILWLLIAGASATFSGWFFWGVINNYHDVSFEEVWSYAWAATISLLLLHSAKGLLDELRKDMLE